MKKLFLLLIVAVILPSLVLAEFKLERIDVTVKDIQKDGSARVTESIKFFIIGDYENSIYDSGFNKNDLSFWATNTNLKDVKLHINPNKVNIQDFRITPQPKRNCNPLLNLCHGELIIDYLATPYFSTQPDNSGEYISGTGIFKTLHEKPRTARYVINPEAISFVSTQQGDIILDRFSYLTIVLPQGATIIAANPKPDQNELNRYLTWTNTVLVKFSLQFDVEEGLDKEVSEFFSDFLKGIQQALTGEHGIAILAMVAIFVGTYIYLQSVKRR